MDWMVFISEQWFLFSLLLLCVVGFVILEGMKGGKSISHHELTSLINQDKAIIVDLREAKDYKSGHIAGAINIPHTKLNERAHELDKYRDKTLVVADKMGQHGGTYGKILRDKGFDVNRLQGGMMEWQNQNLPVVKS